MRLDFLMGFMVEALVILILAKLVRDAVLRRAGENVNEMVVQKRSLGAATSQAGYLIGVLLGFLGAVAASAQKGSFLASAAAVALAGVSAIVLQLLAAFVADHLIFRGVKPAPDETADDNVAFALGKAAVSIATGLVLRGALSDPDATVYVRVVWFAVAQVAMVVAVVFYSWLTPYDDMREIRRNNLAAGFPIAGILLSVGLLMEAAVGGRHPGGLGEAAMEAGKFFLIGVNLIYVFRVITSSFLLPKVKRAQAIVGDMNLAAGLQEAVAFLLPALIVTFFMT